MKVMNYLFVIGLLLVSGNSFAQGKSLKKANALYKLNQFSEAIPLYESAIAKKASLSAKTKLAYCYRMTNQMAPAAKLYAEIVKEERSTVISKFYYAETLMGLEKYDEAQEWFIKYHTERPDDRQAEALIKSCKLVKYIQPYFQNIKVKNFTQNSDNDDSAPILYRDGIVFCSDRNQGAKLLKKKSGWTGRDFLAVYFSPQNIDETFEPAKSFSNKINELNKNTGPVTFNREGTEIIYTQNSSVANNRDQYPMQLYHASSEDGSKWKGKEVLPFCSPNYNFMHPALSPDGKRLFFISDKKGGEGGTDIFMSERTDRGWTRPKNLGNIVNTVANEAFPFVHEDGKLYFSSKGHVGYGGFDIFFTEQQADGSWMKPVNIGKPINSAADDISIAIAADNTRGAFSSSRKNGDDDIFLFKTTGGSNTTTDPYSITLVEEEEPMPIATSQPAETPTESMASNPDPTAISSSAEEAKEAIANSTNQQPNRVIGTDSEEEKTNYSYEMKSQEVPIEQTNTEITNTAAPSQPAEQGEKAASIIPEAKASLSSVEEAPTSISETATKEEEKFVEQGQDIANTAQAPASNSNNEFSYEISPAETKKEASETVNQVTETAVKTPPTKAAAEVPAAKIAEQSSEQVMTGNHETMGSAPLTAPPAEEVIKESVASNEQPEVPATNIAQQTEKVVSANQENISPEVASAQPVGEAVQEITIRTDQPAATPAQPAEISEIPASSMTETPPEDTNLTAPRSSMETKRINTAPTLFEGTVDTETRPATPAPSDAPLTIKNYIDLGYALSKERATVGQTFRLPNISYAFDAFDFQVNDDIASELNKLVEIMKEHPELKLEIGGHTSSYGEDRVNLEISRERADAALDYLVNRGVSSNRLVARGYGETQPQNHCVNGVLCTREEHLMNQRLEIKVLGN